MLELDQDELRRRLLDYRRVIAAETAAGRPASDAMLDARRMSVVILWILGEADGCWREYGQVVEVERRRALALPGAVPGPEPWYGAPLGGRSLLVDCWRGGFGDLIQFVRFAAGLERLDGPVTLQTRPELLRLFSGSFGTALRWTDTPPEGPAADLATAYYALPVQLRWDLAQVEASVPYLHPPAAPRERWRGRLAGWPRPWVGLCWTREEVDVRCVPLASLAPLLCGRRATFFSLQKGGRAAEIRGSGCAETLVDLAGELATFDATAAMMANLDLVISIDTSLAHLAGALGRRTWLLLMQQTADGWNIGPTRDTVRWYPTMRLLRQESQGDWGSVLRQVGEGLARDL